MPAAVFAVAPAVEAGLPPRAPDYEAENRALLNVAQTLADSPRAILQNAAHVALELCRASSAGISVVQEGSDPPVFRWLALTGRLAPFLATTAPRTFRPRGIALDRGAIHLISQPAAHHAARQLPCLFEEALLIPLRATRRPSGILWVMAHDHARRFDAEDARLITSLGQFVATLCDAAATRERLEAGLLETRGAATLLKVADGNKDRFMAFLAHEVRSHLAPIKNVAESLKCETLGAGARAHASGIVERQVAAMTRLVDDLLDAVRARTGTLELRRSRVELRNVVESALEIVHPVVLARDHVVIVDLPAELVCLADAQWLCHALQNLLGNAAKYTEPGGRISVSGRRDGADVVLTVADTGKGLSPSELATIFDLYARVGKAEPASVAEGIGIGLSLVRLLVEGHGGRIHATSAGPGCGSEFVIRLPCAPAVTRPQRASDAVTAGQLPADDGMHSHDPVAFA